MRTYNNRHYMDLDVGGETVLNKEESLALEIYIKLVTNPEDQTHEDLFVEATLASEVWWRMWKEEHKG